jgi:hypothetical protein
MVADRRLHLLARHYLSFAHPHRHETTGPRRRACPSRCAGTPPRCRPAKPAGGEGRGGACRTRFSTGRIGLWFLPKVMHLLDVERAALAAERSRT